MIHKVLGIRQPYASMVAHGYKTLEIRTKRVKTPQRVAIYASGSKYDNDALGELIQRASKYVDLSGRYPKFQRHAILGTAEIAECFEITSPQQFAELEGEHFAAPEYYKEGKTWGWRIRDFVPYSKPLPFKFSSGCVVFAYADIDLEKMTATAITKSNMQAVGIW